MKKILFLLMISLVAGGLAGCQETPTTQGPSKSYNLMGQREVNFVTPGEPWSEKVQTVTEEDAELGMPAGTVVSVTFRRPEKEGLIAVAALGQQKDESGEFIELENDQKTLDQIAMWVVKRDGELTTQEYIKVLGVNAFRMVFDITKGEKKEKGEQIHFTKDGFHYTLSMLVPADEYSAQEGHFRHLVESFTVKNTGSAPAAPAASATPETSATP